MKESKKRSSPVTSEIIPLYMAASTTNIALHNDGADDKFDIHLSLSDGAGAYKRVLIVDRLTKGQRIKIDLLPLKIRATSAALMYRGKDGIGRYLYANNTPPVGKFFVSLICSWVAIPSDPTIEEAFLQGQQ